MRILPIVTACLLLAACANRPPSDRVALPEGPPPGEPAGAVGLSDAALKVAFGLPAFVRRDGEVELWRYDGAGCRAFFFLYPDKSVLTVRHVETMPRPASAAFDAACLSALRRAPAPVS